MLPDLGRYPLGPATTQAVACRHSSCIGGETVLLVTLVLRATPARRCVPHAGALRCW